MHNHLKNTRTEQWICKNISTNQRHSKHNTAKQWITQFTEDITFTLLK